jgi:hypothetical protein
VSARSPEATSQDSRKPRASRGGISGADALRYLLAAAAFGGAVLLVISDFTTLFRIHTEAGVTVPGGAVKGHSNHSWAMLIIGVAALPMAWFAVGYGSRPAMTGLGALGLIALVVAVGFDLSDATGTNTLARTFESATGSPSTGFYLETLGAVLLLFSGGASLVLTAPNRSPRPNRRPPATRPERPRQPERSEDR